MLTEGKLVVPPVNLKFLITISKLQVTVRPLPLARATTTVTVTVTEVLNSGLDSDSEKSSNLNLFNCWCGVRYVTLPCPNLSSEFPLDLNKQPVEVQRKFMHCETWAKLKVDVTVVCTSLLLVLLFLTIIYSQFVVIIAIYYSDRKKLLMLTFSLFFLLSMIVFFFFISFCITLSGVSTPSLPHLASTLLSATETRA